MARKKKNQAVEAELQEGAQPEDDRVEIEVLDEDEAAVLAEDFEEEVDDSSEEEAEEADVDDDVYDLDEDPDEEEDPENGIAADAEKVHRDLAQMRDNYMRTLADFDNFRKRSEREMREHKRYALTEPMREILQVVDNLERALDAAKVGTNADDLKVGVEMTLRQMQEVLRRFGVVPVHAIGERFDPTVHEAISREEDAQVQHPTVRHEMQRGYKLHERLLRPSLVAVAVPGAAPAKDGDGAAEDDGTDA